MEERDAGGLALVWNNPANLNIRCFSLNHIDSRVDSLIKEAGILLVSMDLPKRRTNDPLVIFLRVCMTVRTCHGFVGVTLT